MRKEPILVRYKGENDSDYHLALSDTGGRTMIAEIPSPSWVGSSSPFLSRIRGVRSAFAARFHPSDRFQWVRVRMQISAVGFFDFRHGHSGVAPNGIELHPVLGFSMGATLPGPPPSPAVGRPRWDGPEPPS